MNHMNINNVCASCLFFVEVWRDAIIIVISLVSTRERDVRVDVKTFTLYFYLTIVLPGTFV